MNTMTVQELIEKLQKFKPDMQVIVSDGYDCRFYRGEFDVQEFEGEVDIGIGGCLILDGEDE